MKNYPKLPKRFPTGERDKNGKMICVGDTVIITNAYADEKDLWEICFGKTTMLPTGLKDEDPMPYIGIFIKNLKGIEDSLLFYIENNDEYEVEVI